MTIDRRGWIFSVVAACVLTVAGCGSTQIQSSWKDAGYSAAPLQRVLVVGIADEAAVRKIFEDTFTEQLRAMGVSAEPSYRRMPEVKQGDAAAIKAAAHDIGMDKVLVTHLVGVEKKEFYNPPVTTPMPYSPSSTYGQYYSTVYDYVHEPGYYSTHEFVKLETSLYEMETEKLIWRAATETVDPEDARKAAQDLCRVLLRDMKAKGLID